MRTSGNGSHRRPRQASKFVVTVGATGAGIALPLLTSAGAAHAATTSTWDRVAACETGGDWTSTTDGFAGGLALTQPSWLEYGGADYALTPDLATRPQQIAVAQKILDAQGPDYWGDCAATAGLTGGPAPSADPGQGPGGSGLLGGLLGGPSATATPSAGATASPAPGATAPAAPAASPSAGPGATNPSSPGADSGGSPDSSGVAGASSGRHARPGAALDGDRPGAGATGRGAHARPETSPEGAGENGAYTVRPGDNLYEIATKHSLPGGWPALYDANRATVGQDPGLIHPGQVLTLD